MSLGSGIEFIHRVRVFGERALGLNFAGSFERFDPSLSTANWLYASSVYRIESAFREKKKTMPFHFSWERERLYSESQRCVSRGLDTYLFSAEAHGGGDCPITEELLRSERVRQCYVVLHEGWHSTLKKEGVELPYVLEEATGRAVGNFGAIAFAKKEEDSALFARACEQERGWARFADYINRWHRNLTALYENVAEEVRRSAKKPAGNSRSELIEKVRQARGPSLKKANREGRNLAASIRELWETKELGNSVNNAFILRYYNYTKYYPLAVRTLRETGGLAAACLRFKGLTPVAAASPRRDFSHIALR